MPDPCQTKQATLESQDEPQCGGRVRRPPRPAGTYGRHRLVRARYVPEQPVRSGQRRYLDLPHIYAPYV